MNATTVLLLIAGIYSGVLSDPQRSRRIEFPDAILQISSIPGNREEIIVQAGEEFFVVNLSGTKLRRLPGVVDVDPCSSDSLIVQVSDQSWGKYCLKTNKTVTIQVPGLGVRQIREVDGMSSYVAIDSLWNLCVLRSESPARVISEWMRSPTRGRIRGERSVTCTKIVSVGRSSVCIEYRSDADGASRSFLQWVSLMNGSTISDPISAVDPYAVLSDGRIVILNTDRSRIELVGGLNKVGGRTVAAKCEFADLNSLPSELFIDSVSNTLVFGQSVGYGRTVEREYISVGISSNGIRKKVVYRDRVAVSESRSVNCLCATQRGELWVVTGRRNNVLAVVTSQGLPGSLVQ